MSPFIVAEIGANHLGSLDRALALVGAAADAGCDAVKLQCWSPDSMAIAGSWKGKSLPDLYRECWTPWDWYGDIFHYATIRSIEVFASAFDCKSVTFLESLGVKRHKVSSFELTDWPLIACVAATGKPLILSTGMATPEEVHEAIYAAGDPGCITLLHCTSAYPAAAVDANLCALPIMRSRHGCKVGLSDHTPGIGVAVAAVALGAEMIEKHLTLRRSDGGPDSAHSLEPEEFKQLVAECRRAAEALGEVRYGPSDSETESVKLRRSLWITQDMEPGDIFSAENLQSMRPADGIHPRHLPDLYGKPVSKLVKAGTPMRWELV